MNTLLSGLAVYWAMHNVEGNDIRGHTGSAASTVYTLISDAYNPPTVAAGRVKLSCAYTSAGAQASYKTGGNLMSNDITYTFTMWYYPLAFVTTKRIISKDNNSGTGRAYGLQSVAGTPNTLQWIVFRSGPTAMTVTSSVNPVTDTWYFICCGHNHVTNKIWIEVNGVYNEADTDGAAQDSNASAFFVNSWIGGDTERGDMRLCELGRWDRELVPAERAWLYNSGKGRTYPFDGRPNLVSATRARRNRIPGQVA